MPDLIPYRTQVPDFLPGALDTLGPGTREQYAIAAKQLAAFVGARDMASLAQEVLGRGCGHANHVAFQWKAMLLEREYSPSYINLRLSMLRWAAKRARILEIIDYAIEVGNVKGETYRDTAGCGRAGYEALLGNVGVAIDDATAVRDRAAIRLMYGLGLRRVELTRLRMEDLDFEGSRVAVLGKGKHERVWLDVPEPVMADVAAWATHPGRQGPMLFEGREISWLNKMLKRRGKAAGVKARPHGLRHSSITDLLDRNGGNIREAAAFARHRNINTTDRYDDNRKRLQGKAAAMLV